MRLLFKGDIVGLDEGIKVFAKELDFELACGGLEVHVEICPSGKLEVLKKGNTAVLKCPQKIHFFRALGILVEALRESDEFEIVEEPQFTMNGVMFDVSQGNAVINVEYVKRILVKMALMGLNMLMLYSEDSYEVKEEPYFGYMRGKYSQDELKELDEYAFFLGIEIIPCIQTLAHLIDVLKWYCYEDIKEDDDTLLVGCDRAYEFIENIIAAAAAPFRTKRIHIGMDEAWKLGQGNYLLKYGYRRKLDIMTEHLEKVLQITSKYKLEPMIWGDMFFRAAASETGNYYDRETVIPPEIIERVPKNVQLVYWDYNHHSEEPYMELIKKHRELGSDTVFAGGIWGWNGFGVDYDKTFITTNPALNACKKAGVKEVFATIWGDGGTECNVFTHLLGMQLFAEHGYARELDTDKLKKRFKFCTGCDFDDYYNVTYIDKLQGMEPVEGYCYVNPSKYLLWQDLLAGLFDKDIDGMELNGHYMEMREKMEAAIPRNGEFGFVFEFLGKLCSVLEMKAEIGLKLTRAYSEKDMDTLKYFADTELATLYGRVESLRVINRDLWMQINKPLGWEILDIRYGGLLARIDTTKARISSYLEGKISNVEELEQERLTFSGKPGFTGCNYYSKMPSASRISFSLGF